MTKQNWIRIVQKNYRHYNNINSGQNVHNAKFWTNNGGHFGEHPISRNVFWTALME